MTDILSSLKTDTIQMLMSVNNTSNILKASSIFSEYNNYKFIGCKQTGITLLPNKEIIMKTGNNSNKISHLLWSGLNNLTQLATKREIE